MANKFIPDGLKKRIDASGRKWVNELENLLWAVRTILKKSTGESPFRLIYRSEVVVLVKFA